MCHQGCDQSLAINALKRLMDQLGEKILQTDQLQNASKHLQYRVDHTPSIQVGKHPSILGMRAIELLSLYRAS